MKIVFESTMYNSPDTLCCSVGNVPTNPPATEMMKKLKRQRTLDILVVVPAAMNGMPQTSSPHSYFSSSSMMNMITLNTVHAQEKGAQNVG